MAGLDETAIRSPRQAPESVRPGDIRPWMVWSAAGAIGALAVTGLVLGFRGSHPTEDGGLALSRGPLLNPATAALASPAVALPKDTQWSTLSGPEILPKVRAVPRATATAAEASGEEASAAPAAATAAAELPEPAIGDEPAAPEPPPTSSAAGAPTP